MTPEDQKPIGKNTLRFLEIVGRVDDALARITFPVWKRILATRGVEMYKVESLGEQQALIRRIAPLIEDAVEIHIAEGDLSESLLSERGWSPDSRIKITAKLPAGDAPKEFRRLWKGIELNAYRLPASDQNEEVNLVSGIPITSRRVDLYAVSRDEALQALEKKSPRAAEWFRNFTSANVDSLTFAANEVKVIKRNQGRRL